MIVPKARRMSSGSWFIYLRLGGEQVSVSAATEKECVRQAQLIKAEYLAGKRAAPKPEEPAGPTLGQAMDAFIAKRKAVLSPATIRGYQIIRRNRFQGLMDRDLTRLTADDWQKACSREVSKCSAKTLHNAWGLVSTVIQDATGAPPPKVKLPQIILNKHEFLEPEQIRPFMEAVQGTELEIPALLALHSLRLSEILALTWESIDLDKRIIKVRGAVVTGEENKPVRKAENKNATSARNVPIMIDQLYDALIRQKEAGGPLVAKAPNNLRIRLNRLCEENGFGRVGFHGLRHSFVSLAYHLGIPEKIVMELGGWSDFQTMRRIYTHVAKSDVSRYTEQMKAFFSPEKADGEPVL